MHISNDKVKVKSPIVNSALTALWLMRAVLISVSEPAVSAADASPVRWDHQACRGYEICEYGYGYGHWWQISYPRQAC